MTHKTKPLTIDEVFAPIQAEYDGGEAMLPGTIPDAKAQLKQLFLDVVDGAFGSTDDPSNDEVMLRAELRAKIEELFNDPHP